MAFNIYKITPSNLDFSFKEISISETEIELRELNWYKSTTFSNIPTKNLKQKSNSCPDTSCSYAKANKFLH